MFEHQIRPKERDGRSENGVMVGLKIRGWAIVALLLLSPGRWKLVVGCQTLEFFCLPLSITV